MTGSPPDIEALGLDGLKRLVLQLLEEVASLKVENAALREEIARLKGLKGRSKLAPSGMEKARERRAAAGQGGKTGRRGGKLERLVIDEEQVIAAAAPAGSRFKGYEDYVVQDLILRPHVVRFRCERWLTPEGKTIVAPLPARAWRSDPPTGLPRRRRSDPVYCRECTGRFDRLCRRGVLL